MAAKITGRCAYAINSLKVTRKNNVLTWTWKIPSNATNSNVGTRAETNCITIVEGYNSKEVVRYYESDLKPATLTISRTMYFPWTKVVTFKSRLWNEKGFSKTTVTDSSIKFSAPNKPKTVAFSDFDNAKHTLKVTITAGNTDINKPRSSVNVYLYRDAVVNGVKQKTVTLWNNVAVLGWDSSTTTSWTKTLSNVEPTAITKETDYICYTLKAQARSPIDKTLNEDERSPVVTKRFYIAFPNRPTITKVSYTSGGVELAVKGNWKESRPTETLQAQIGYADKLANVTDWEDIGTEATCPQNANTVIGIALANSKIAPDVGQHVWVRIEANARGRTPVYSNVWQLDDNKYYTSGAGDEDAPTEDIEIEKVDLGDDGQSLNVRIGYNDLIDATTKKAYNATELTYSTDSNAWKSSQEPTSVLLDDDNYWRDSTPATGSTHANTSQIKLAGLEEGTTYYIRARRYLLDNTKYRTHWSARGKGNTSYVEIKSVVLSAPDVVATSKDAVFSWTFDDEMEQTNWSLACDGDIIETGTGSITSCSHAFDSAGDKSLTLTSIFKNGNSATSDPVIVSVVDAPVLSFTTEPASLVTALPASFSIACDNADAEIQANVNSQGITLVTPAETKRQYLGDTVASFSGQGGSLDCTLSDGTTLWDNGDYHIYAVATANGVKSDPLEADFTVAYTDTVTAPEDSEVAITPIKDKGATIQVDTLSAGTTWDLYRATNDGRNFLIAQDLEAGAIATDNYAPYSTSGTCKYLILVKNSQGQFDYREYEYTANYKTLRFDWVNNYVELPYNIEISDESDKQFEQQVYLDGTQRGAWGASVVRSSSLSTDTVYLKDEETIRKVRELARYQGAVFVRTPLGQAYTANVEVNNISKVYDSKAVAVSFDVTEIDLTTDFCATTDADATT